MPISPPNNYDIAGLLCYGIVCDLVSSGVWSTNRIAKDVGNQRGNEEQAVEHRTLQTVETTIALHLTKRHEGNVLNPIDSHYSRRRRQRAEKRHT